MAIAEALANIKVLLRQEAKDLGLTHYYNGIACKQGHLDFRDVKSSGCMECARLYYRNKTQVKRDIRTYEVLQRSNAAQLNQIHYFTGLPCEVGHICKRYVNDAKCVECIANRNKVKKLKNKKIYCGPEIPSDIKTLITYQKAQSYRAKNKERIKENNRRYSLSEKGRAKVAERRSKYEHDLEYKLNHVISSIVRRALKSRKAGKRWQEFLPYNVDDLKTHLENKFTPEMTWENHGVYWHIDHVIPLSWFDVTNKSELDTCWSLNNLQPLEASLNIKKNNRYAG